MKKIILYSIMVGFFTACQTPEPAKPKPQASFSFQTGASGVVGFFNNSLNATSYVWTFGDGETSTAKNPVHQFGRNAQFGVTLKATGDGGTDVANSSVTVNNILGNLIVYKATVGGNGRNINVSVDGLAIGTINGGYYFPAAPNCTVSYCAVAALTEGVHTVLAKEATGLSPITWSYKVTVTGGVCNTSGLTY